MRTTVFLIIYIVTLPCWLVALLAFIIWRSMEVGWNQGESLVNWSLGRKA